MTLYIFPSLKSRIDSQRGGAPEFSGEMLGWVLSGFSVGSQNMNIFQKVDKNYFQRNWRKRCKKNAKDKTGSQWVLGWVLNGFSVGPQRVLSEYSGYSDCAFLSTQGILR